MTVSMIGLAVALTALPFALLTVLYIGNKKARKGWWKKVNDKGVEINEHSPAVLKG